MTPPPPRGAPAADLQAAAEAAQDEQVLAEVDVDKRAGDLRADAAEDRPGAEQLDRARQLLQGGGAVRIERVRAGDVEDHVGRPLRDAGVPRG